MAKKKANPRQNRPVEHIVPASERRAQGKALRDTVPRQEHAKWQVPNNRPDPIDILEKSNEGRVPELIPIRYGRMMASPFTFFRGSAALMAADLAHTPATGVRVQACGDCHLLNFGGYATPERHIVVDLNDFDETLPAPWEWDLKRLATSFILAGRANGFKARDCREIVETVVCSYRTTMNKLSDMRVLDVWYAKLDLDIYLSKVDNKGERKRISEEIEREKKKSSAELFVPKLTTEQDGRRVFKDNPPLLYHMHDQRDEKFFKLARETFELYKETLPDERRILMNRYQLQDVAMKVVGIGSVGTYCAALLLTAEQDDHLILQVKQANASVLEPYAGKSVYSNHGQRVVNGQRLMQSHSDIFLGWMRGTGKAHRHFYLRQLRDTKLSPTPEFWDKNRAIEVGEAFGWVLARAHARSGDAVMIGGYLGNSDSFDRAIAQFAEAYADQTERDHATLLKAIKSRRINAYIER